MKHLRVLALAATALLGAVSTASAQEAYTTNDVSLRAGPGTRYPAVRMIPEDAVVYVHGCLRNWDWCDVSWRRSRGWVFSDYLEGIYQDERLSLDEWRDYVDVPFVSFGFGYWDRYYRDRPWYGSWERWGDRNDRAWRQRHRGNDSWSDADSNWNRNGSNDQDNNNTRRRRGSDSNANDDGNNRTDDGRMQCAPDDPNCDDGSFTRRNRRSNQQMEDQQQ